MEWKLTGDRPIWLQLKEQITQRIVTGVYPMGGRLPTVRDLATEAGVNPNTMQRALSELENDGLAVTNRTAGRLVTTDASVVETVRDALASKCMMDFYDGMAQLGFSREEAKRKLEEAKEDGQ
jgi:DNA-binding transcriptional regulator YhcF (GntR family)